MVFTDIKFTFYFNSSYENLHQCDQTVVSIIHFFIIHTLKKHIYPDCNLSVSILFTFNIKLGRILEWVVTWVESLLFTLLCHEYGWCYALLIPMQVFKSTCSIKLKSKTHHFSFCLSFQR